MANSSAAGVERAATVGLRNGTGVNEAIGRGIGMLVGGLVGWIAGRPVGATEELGIGVRSPVTKCGADAGMGVGSSTGADWKKTCSGSGTKRAI